MPWHVEQSGECPASRPYAVVKDDDGSIEGCHASEADAQAQLTALNIAESEGRAYEDINFSPPEGVRNEAQRGLDWRREYGRGGTEVGIARARDLAGGRTISPETAKRMKAYFDRHEIDKQGEGWSPGEDGYPSNGRIAWALWGGDAGRSWSAKLVRQINAEDNTQDQRRRSRPLHPLVMQDVTEQGMSYIDERMAMIFNEWARRYSEKPNEFGQILDSNGKPIEDYGQRCTVYFKKIADEMDAAGVLPVVPPPSA